MKLKSLLKSRAGHSVMELIVGVAITGIVVPVGNHVISTFSRSYNIQAEVSDMNISVRKVSALISNDLRTAGYDPLKTGIIAVPFSSTALQINRANKAKNENTENITYVYSEDTRSIIRTCDGVSEVVAENMQDFSFVFLDTEDNIVASAENQNSICKIEFVVTGRTAEPDPHFNQNAGFRTLTFTSTILPSTLMYQ
jgi:hypothetical protein